MSEPQGNLRELGWDFLQHPMWHKLQERLKKQHLDRNKKSRELLKQGQYHQSVYELGWVDAVEWMATLPKQMLKTVSKKEQENGNRPEDR